jgi:hypothetical protein
MLLKQLVYQLANIPKPLCDLYDQKSRDGREPDLASFVTLLKGCFAEFTTVWILLDAFDECLEHERPTLLNALKELPKSQLKLFMTGRPPLLWDRNLRYDEMLQTWLEGYGTQEIEGKPEDIKRYIEAKLRKEAKGIERQFPKHHNIVSEIATPISTGVKQQCGTLFFLLTVLGFCWQSSS